MLYIILLSKFQSIIQWNEEIWVFLNNLISPLKLTFTRTTNKDIHSDTHVCVGICIKAWTVLEISSWISVFVLSVTFICSSHSPIPIERCQAISSNCVTWLTRKITRHTRRIWNAKACFSTESGGRGHTPFEILIVNFIWSLSLVACCGGRTMTTEKMWTVWSMSWSCTTWQIQSELEKKSTIPNPD